MEEKLCWRYPSRILIQNSSRPILAVILERFLIPLSSKCVCDLECEDRRLKAEKLQATFMMHLEKNRCPSATADIFFKDGPIKKKEIYGSFTIHSMEAGLIHIPMYRLIIGERLLRCLEKN